MAWLALLKMPHEFIVLVDGCLLTFNKFEDIPEKIDNIIKFLPEIPLPPHTDEQHEEIEEWQNKFKKLLEMEKKNGS